MSRGDHDRDRGGFDIVAVVVILFAVLLAVGGAGTWFAVQTVRRQQVAMMEALRAREAEAMARAMAEQQHAEAQAQMNTTASSTDAPDWPAILAALDRAAERIGAAFHDDPEAEAAVREALARSYRELGATDKADAQQREAERLGARRDAKASEEPHP